MKWGKVEKSVDNFGSTELEMPTKPLDIQAAVVPVQTASFIDIRKAANVSW
ncbi:MAG TPA: hypothetical protein VMQ44_03460 [Candidatus Saccharimonadales bacterium]|nr:hypothetical protein [Candidatus Saccharimonadales bacterium]